MAAGESLRLHQPVPTLLRIALKDVTLASGRKIAKDERIALFFTPANRETGVFGADANEFNPYRVAPPKLQPWGLTFGGGVHMCIGRPLATGMFNRVDDRNGTEGRPTRRSAPPSAILTPTPRSR
jgi:cytochrome P450